MTKRIDALHPEDATLMRRVRAAVERNADVIARKARAAQRSEARRIKSGQGASFLEGGQLEGGAHTDRAAGGEPESLTHYPSFLPPSDPNTQVVWSPQPGPQYHFIHCPVTDVVFGGARGGGKLHPMRSMVCTPKGWRRIGDLEVGDFVTDPTNGGATRVTAIFPQGEQDIYRVTCDDGASCEVGLEHLWAYRLANHRKPRSKASSERQFAVDMLGATMPDDRWEGLRVGTTSDVLRAISEGHGVRIPLTEPVIFTVNGRLGSGSVDPYIAGVLLGDGHIESLTVTACDDEVRGALVAAGFQPHSGLHTDGKPKSWGSSGVCRRALREWVGNHGLTGKHSWDKFVPSYVLTASLEYRLSFLQGLMDTDGTVDERGRCYFTSTSEALSEGVRHIVRSLGGKASSRERVTSYTHKGEKLEGRPSWTIRIWMRKTSVLFRVARKKARCTDSWNGGHELTREIVSVKKVGREEARCIRVDSPHSLYLTDDFIVTHNTYALIGDAAIRAGRYGRDFRGLFLRRQQTELADVKMKMAEVYGPIGAKWSEQHQTWTFPGGGTLVLKYLMNDDDALLYKGWNLCVERDTPVLMADGSWKPIRDIGVGEMVSTLEGPRPVVATTEPYLAPCAEIRVSVPGVGEVARQVQPVWHHVLTTDGLTHGPSPRSPGTQPPPRDRWLPGREDGELRRGVGRGRPGWLAWQEDGPSDSVESWDGRPEWRLPELSSARIALHEPALRSTLRRRGSGGLSGAPEYAGSPVDPARRGAAGGSDASIEAGSPGGCRPSGDSHGGRPPRAPGNGPTPAPSRGDAGERTLPNPPQGEPGTAPGCTQPSSGWYWTHPYTGEGHHLREDLRSGELESAYVGPRLVCDISVAHANHYITLGGIVNRNTALYVDEIGDFQSRRCIDLLWGAMRSAKGVPIVRRMSCNPGGPGHMWVKQLYLSHGRYRVFRYTPNPELPDMTIDAVFIPSRLEDNKILMQNDPMYETRLSAACGGDMVLYHAWREGDWDGLAGAYFTFSEANVAVPPPIPPYLQRWMAIDWGYTHPTAVQWGVDFGDRAYVYRERYYTNTEPVSLGMFIAEVNGDEPISNVYLSPDAFAKRTSVNTVASELEEGFRRAHEMKGLALIPSPEMAFNDRVNGWQVLAAGLGQGRLLISPSCPEIIRTLPSMVRDPKKPNDVQKVDGDDACLVAGTMVTMADGTARAIETLVPGDVVATPCGPGVVSMSGRTGRGRELAEIVLEDGRSVRGTPDHHLFDEAGRKKRIDEFMPGDKILVWQYLKQSNSTASSSAATPAPGSAPIESTSPQRPTIAGEGSGSSTRRSGGPPTGTSHPDTSSTTPTRTPGTTPPETSSASPTPNTLAGTGPRSEPSGPVDRPSASAPCLPPGTDPGQGWPGTERTPPMFGSDLSSTSPWRRNATTVVSRFSTGPATKRDGSAPTTASRHGDDGPGSTMSTAPASDAAGASGSTGTSGPGIARVAALRMLSETGDVYNLTVDCCHRFYANGILSSNCDCLRYLWATRQGGKVNVPMELRAAQEITAENPTWRAMQERIFLSRENAVGGDGDGVTIRGRRRFFSGYE